MLYFYSDPDLTASQATVERNRARPDGEYGRCLLCEAPVNDRSKAKWFYLHRGGSAIVTEAEAAALNETDERSADCGYHPIGPECFRKHKALLAPYVNGGQQG